MDEDDVEKTAFIMEDKLYQFKVLPFGLCNTGATFQRLMQLALSGLSWEQVLDYIDDLNVHCQTKGAPQPLKTGVRQAGSRRAKDVALKVRLFLT